VPAPLSSQGQALAKARSATSAVATGVPRAGRLQARFLILSNELPRLADASGALASRFVVLVMTKSFYGKEDLGLTERLLGELPGLLNWAIAGWRRLTERGHFVQPRSALDAVQQLKELGGPINAFLRERCEIGSSYRVDVDDLYSTYRDWCGGQGQDRPSTKQTFGRDLHAAIPGLRVVQLRDGKDRWRA
jgi:putative DNA primase/helicase